MSTKAVASPVYDHQPSSVRPVSTDVENPAHEAAETPEHEAQESDAGVKAGTNNRGGNDGGYGRTEPPYQVPPGMTGPIGPGAMGVIPGIAVVPTMPAPPPMHFPPDALTRLTRKVADIDGTIREGDAMMPRPIG